MSFEFPEDVNPYAAPQVAPPARPLPIDGGLWREGSILVAVKGTLFPDRCVKCNAPAEGYRLKRFLYWHHPAYYLVILVCNILIYIIVAQIVRQTATFYIGLCKQHRRTRRNAIMTGWLMILLGVCLFIVAISRENGWLAFAALAPTLHGIFYGILGSQMIRAKRIDKTYAWIAGTSPEFLATLPEEVV